MRCVPGTSRFSTREHGVQALSNVLGRWIRDFPGTDVELR